MSFVCVFVHETLSIIYIETLEKCQLKIISITINWSKAVSRLPRRVGGSTLKAVIHGYYIHTILLI